jgi:putative DNA base modification enzyme with NMAD domain
VTLWRYVITNDDGSAPNYARPRVTLAICKPKIRKAAKKGDIIIAFAGRQLRRTKGTRWNPHAVIWAGVVSDSLPFAKYWIDARFRNKRPDRSKCADNIYRPVGARLVQVPSGTHLSAKDQKRDRDGHNVLVLSPAWHFGEHGEPLPNGFSRFRIEMRARRGHRRDEIEPAVEKALVTWLRTRCKSLPSRISSGRGAQCNSAMTISRGRSCGVC